MAEAVIGVRTDQGSGLVNLLVRNRVLVEPRHCARARCSVSCASSQGSHNGQEPTLASVGYRLSPPVDSVLSQGKPARFRSGRRGLSGDMKN